MSSKRPYDEGDDAWEGEPPAKLASCSKGDVAAARAKANREKQRREKLNGRFAELSALIDPGKPPKTDRNVILEDAVRVIQQLRVENNQIKQLNKFLEEKVQDNERAQGAALYRQAMAAQAALPPVPPNPSLNNLSPSALMAMMQASAPSTSSAASNSSAMSPALMAQMFNFMQMLQNAQAAAPGPSSAPENPSHRNSSMSALQSIFGSQGDDPGGHLHPRSPPTRAGDFGQEEPPQTHAHVRDADDKRGRINHGGGVSSRDDLLGRPNLDTQVKMAYHQLNSGSSFSFTPPSGSSANWPLSSMLDMTMDSQLRPPAA